MSAGVLDALEDRLDRLGLALMGWRPWAWTLVALGLGAVASALLFWPDAEGQVALLGAWSFPPCGVLAETGLPCSQCGMTRSWVWAVRGRWVHAVGLNPAGFALWLWLVAGALVGAVRLLRRRPVARLGWPALWFSGFLWLVLLVVGHQLRLAGMLPLP